jgi:hypothetical protein
LNSLEQQSIYYNATVTITAISYREKDNKLYVAIANAAESDLITAHTILKMDLNGSNVEPLVTVENPGSNLVISSLVVNPDGIAYYTYMQTWSDGNNVDVYLYSYNMSSNVHVNVTVPTWSFVNIVTQLMWYNNQLWVCGPVSSYDQYLEEQISIPTIASFEWESDGSITSYYWLHVLDTIQYFSVYYFALYDCSIYYGMTQTTTAIRKLEGMR